MIFTRWQPRLRARPERKVQKVPKMPEAQRQPRLQVRQRVQLQQNNYHAGRKKAEHVTRIPCYRHCAAAFFLSSIYISQAFKITARCKNLLSDVMTSCLFCLSILCIFLDNNLQFPQFSLKKKLYPFCIICLLNILKRTEYYGKFASKTLT